MFVGMKCLPYTSAQSFMNKAIFEDMKSYLTAIYIANIFKERISSYDTKLRVKLSELNKGHFI